VRGVWAPVGERPIALGHHRFEWLYGRAADVVRSISDRLR